MSTRLAPLIASLVLAAAGAAQAQSPRPLPATLPMRFESWHLAGTLDHGINLGAGQFAATSRDRTRHALLGGAIGAVVGVQSRPVLAATSTTSPAYLRAVNANPWPR